jgi:signal transduction histidine kinase
MRFEASSLVKNLAEQLKVFSRGIRIETGRMKSGVLLPFGSLAEWSTIFQNVFMNAFNALTDSEKKVIDVSSRRLDGIVEILVQNTGPEVDLAESEELFKPFVRKMKISPEREQLGYGGSGLGLTIVRLIADSLACTVAFVKPQKGFNTAFSITWVESE